MECEVINKLDKYLVPCSSKSVIVDPIHRAILEVIDQMTNSKGLRILSEAERKPILREFFNLILVDFQDVLVARFSRHQSKVIDLFSHLPQLCLLRFSEILEGVMSLEREEGETLRIITNWWIAIGLCAPIIILLSTMLIRLWLENRMLKKSPVTKTGDK